MVKRNLNILNSSNKKRFDELYFPRVLANFWMEEKLILLIKKMREVDKKFSVFFDIKFIKGEVISISKNSDRFSNIFLKGISTTFCG